MQFQHDFTTKAALSAVLADIVGPGDMFFFCSPCTGGSSWQHLNLSTAFQRGCSSTVHKLIGHWDLHWRLWEHFEVVARHCKKVGASCILEWPAGCAYWREERVQAFLDELGFVSTWFDGWQRYLNSSEFTARDGGGLAALAESVRDAAAAWRS